MKPNQMPKRPNRPNRLAKQVIHELISVEPSRWKKKTLAKDSEGKESVETAVVTHQVLRSPLAQNVSDENVERLARKWL